MVSRSRSRWLDDLAVRGETMVGELFGFDRLAPDWSVRFDAGLPEELIYLLVAGAIHGQVRGRSVTLRPGSLLWLPVRTPFRLHTADEVIPVLYRFRLTRSGPGPQKYLVLLDAWDLRSTMDALVRELGSALEFRPQRVRALLVVFFSSLFRLADRSTQVPPLPAADRARLEEYVDDRLADRPTSAELAAVLRLSPDYFRRRFRQTFGLAPRTWLVRRRIQQAMSRLDESDATISDIATALGYPDVFLFSRQFKLITGVSPRAWRSRAQH
ncbi:MAG: helix-turn-helix domain-containing protein [Mycobacterium sp.]|nr:helix-turn-helix domain-containing protein [Mycobacterium sp.]